MQEYKATVQSLRQLTPTVYELSFLCEPELAFSSGSFVKMGPMAKDDAPPMRKYFSIASGDEKRPYQLCIKTGDGPFDEWLTALQEGDAFVVEGPGGAFRFRAPSPHKEVVMIATGTGITPLRSMLQSSAFSKASLSRVCLLFGFWSEEEILYAEEWEASGFETIYMLDHPSQAWQEKVGWVTDYLREHPNAFDWQHTDFYICGQSQMLAAVKEILKDYGVEEDSIHHERW